MIKDLMKSVEAAPPEDGFASTIAGIERLKSERVNAAAELAKLSAGRDGVLLLDDDAAIEKLDRRIATHRRAIERIDIVIPRLVARIDGAKADAIQAKLAKYGTLLQAHVKKVAAAARALATENAKAVELNATAAADIGFYSGIAQIPNVQFLSIATADAVSSYERFNRSLFSPEKSKARSDVASVEVRKRFGCYQVGERIGLEANEAADRVKAGLVAYVDPATAPKPASKPSEAPVPEPDDKGNVTVLALKELRPFGVEGAPNQAGELCGLPVAIATRFVRAGYAEFWAPVAAEAAA